MRVLVLGVDGFVGWPLFLRLAKRGHVVAGVDNFNRRRWVRECGSQSVTPIPPMSQRLDAFENLFGYRPAFYQIDVTNPLFLGDAIRTFKPHCIVHFAEQPSAAYSMKDVYTCLETYRNNVLGTLSLLWCVRKHCPEAHIVHAGTLGVYSYDLPYTPEGDFRAIVQGKEIVVPYPKLGGSFYHACYDENTEVLTRRGWLSFKDLKPNDEVLTWNLETDEVKYEKPRRVFEYDYNGRMYRVKSRKVDLLVTPDHKVVVGDKLKRGLNYKLFRIKDVHKKTKFYRVGIPNWQGEEKEFFRLPSIPFSKHATVVVKEKLDMDAWLQFFGWFLAEGTVYEGKVTICQHKKENFDEIGAVVTRLGYKPSRNCNGISIHSRQLATYLGKFGKQPFRYIPEELKSLSTRQLKILLSALIKGDGCKMNDRFSIYYTTSKRLADDVQEIALKCGYSAMVRRLSVSGKGWRKRDEYRVFISKTVDTQVNLFHNNVTEVSYKGKIYSCDVGGKAVLVRRNGNPVWSGNSKSCDAINLEFAVKTWGLTVTDVHQGIIYGAVTEDTVGDDLLTRLDIDECLGTIAHRLVAQAVVGMPLTLYGKGHQRRGFIPLRDAIQCFTLLIENPPPQGSYRVVNQLENRYDISDVAAKVVEIASEFGISASAGHIPNPRVEIEDNYWYHPTHEKLKELGYKPSTTLEEEIRRLFEVVIRFKNRITKGVLVPRIRWR